MNLRFRSTIFGETKTKRECKGFKNRNFSVPNRSTPSGTWKKHKSAPKKVRRGSFWSACEGGHDASEGEGRRGGLNLENETRGSEKETGGPRPRWLLPPGRALLCYYSNPSFFDLPCGGSVSKWGVLRPCELLGDSLAGDWCHVGLSPALCESSVLFLISLPFSCRGKVLLCLQTFLFSYPLKFWP